MTHVAPLEVTKNDTLGLLLQYNNLRRHSGSEMEKPECTYNIKSMYVELNYGIHWAKTLKRLGFKW